MPCKWRHIHTPAITPSHRYPSHRHSNAFLTWIKVFKYLGFVPKLKILLGTLARAAGKVSGFAFICCVVLFGSSQVRNKERERVCVCEKRSESDHSSILILPTPLPCRPSRLPSAPTSTAIAT